MMVIEKSFYLTDNQRERGALWGIYDKPDQVYRVVWTLDSEGRLQVTVTHLAGELDSHAVTAEAVNRIARHLHELHKDKPISDTAVYINSPCNLA